MARRSSAGTTRLPIRRRFDPARSQLRALAFAFEQALPLTRKYVINSSKEQTIGSFDLDLKTRSATPGAHS
jgi:hypothetical protein